MTQHNKVFRIEHDDDIVIITPQSPESGYRYADVHKESNVVLHLFDTPENKHVLVDLSAVGIMNSTMIGVFVRTFRKVNSNGGNAAFCSASEAMAQVIDNMNLHQIWSLQDTRESGIASIRSN